MRTIQSSITEIAAPTGKGGKKSNILRHILENYTVIFLGYSGRDEFDIYPAICSSSPKQIIWVDHRSEDGVMILESHRDVPASERHDNVSRLMLKHQHTMRLRCNTAVFLAQLSEYLSSHHIEKSDGYDCIDTRHPDRIKVALSPVQFLGYLFQYTHRWQSANETFDLALENWSDRTKHSPSDRKPIDDEIDIVSIAQICRGKGICYKEMGQSSLAHEYLQKAIGIYEALYSERGTDSPITSIHQSHFIMMAQLCEDIALTYYSDKDYDAAIQWASKAISWSRRIVLPKQRLFLARNFGNLGVILQDRALVGKDVTENSDRCKQDLLDADSSFRAAVSAERLCGNIVGLARSLHNWAYLSLLSARCSLSGLHVESWGAVFEA
jgi:tetratricopeptide (TPR) repeat protein